MNEKKLLLCALSFFICIHTHALFFKELGEKYQNIENEYAKSAAKKSGAAAGDENTRERMAVDVCRLFEEKILEAQSSSTSKRAKNEAELKKALGTKHTNGFTPIFYAVLAKNARLVEKMIQYGADVNETDSSQRMPLLFWALTDKSPDYETVKAVLSAKNCNTNFHYTKNQYENVTPLLLSCTTKNPEIIQLVLERATQRDVRGTLPNGRTRLSASPIQYLCAFFDRRNLPSMRTLIEHGADVDSAFSVDGEVKTPLLCAVLSRNDDFFRMVLDSVTKIDETVNVRTDFSFFAGTVLSYACYDSSLGAFGWNCARALVERGANVNDGALAGGNELTPLMLVCALHDPAGAGEKIFYLLEHHADVNRMCRIEGQKLNPFHFVTKHTDFFSESFFTAFRDAGGDMTKADSSGVSPFEYMARQLKNDADKIEFSYIQTGHADFSQLPENAWNQKTSVGALTLLHLALLHHDDESALRMMREEKIDWKTPDGRGRTAFDYAVLGHRSFVLDFFLESGIKIKSALFTLIDDALQTGSPDYLKKFLAEEDFSPYTAHGTDFSDNVNPVVYVALSKASNTGKESVFGTLFSFKEHISHSDLDKKIPTEGKTPLVLALESGDETAALWLLRFGADVEAQGAKKTVFSTNSQTVMGELLERHIPLSDAIFSAIDNEISGNESHLAQFLSFDGESGQNRFLTEPDSEGSRYGAVTYTAKIGSAEHAPRQTKIISALLESGFPADETVRGGGANGETALVIAAKEKNAGLFSFLLGRGASLSARNEGAQAGKTALFYALEKGERTIVSHILKSREFSPEDTKLKDGTTLLMYFAQFATFEELNEVISSFVFKNPTALEKKNRDGRTPFLCAAAAQNDYRILALLRMYGANVNATDADGRNARAIALQSGNTAVVQRLESYGVY